MRHHIPFVGVLLLSGVVNLSCSTAPLGPPESEDVPTIAEPFPHRTSSSSRAAVIIRNSGCGLFDGDGGFVVAHRSFVVATQSTNWNTTLMCKVKNVANSTGRAVSYNSENNPFGPGAACGVFRGDIFVVTTAWTETVSASGNGTLRCRFKR